MHCLMRELAEADFKNHYIILEWVGEKTASSATRSKSRYLPKLVNDNRFERVSLLPELNEFIDTQISFFHDMLESLTILDPGLSVIVGVGTMTLLTPSHCHRNYFHRNRV